VTEGNGESENDGGGGRGSGVTDTNGSVNGDECADKRTLSFFFKKIRRVSTTSCQNHQQKKNRNILI
jgi:hypothetical protein